MRNEEMDYIRTLFEEYRKFTSGEFKELTDKVNCFELKITNDITAMSAHVEHLKKRMDTYNGKAERNYDRKQQRGIFWANLLVRIVFGILGIVTTLKIAGAF